MTRIDDPWREWRLARSFEELCELGAQFCEGKIRRFPDWGGESLDEESSPLAHHLARLNRRGLLTTCSQPGLIDDGYAQRAFVDGYAQRSDAYDLARRAAIAGLFVRLLPPGHRSDESWPVSTADGEEVTWCGGYYPDLSEMGNVCAPSVVRELEHAYYLAVVDPQWGRTEYLWEALLASG